MIEPKPPPSAVCRFSSSTASTPLASPPEKMTMRRPSKALWTTCCTRSASVADLDALGLVDLARRVLLDEVRRRLDLDDVRAELGGDLRGVGAHVDPPSRPPC